MRCPARAARRPADADRLSLVGRARPAGDHRQRRHERGRRAGRLAVRARLRARPAPARRHEHAAAATSAPSSATSPTRASLRRDAAGQPRPAGRLPAARPGRLLPAVLRRDGAAAAHGRRAGAGGQRLLAGGRWTPTRGEYVVRDVDAHSWVEYCCPGIGWVTRDPTPADAPARSQAADLAAGRATTRHVLGQRARAGQLARRRRRRAAGGRGGAGRRAEPARRSPARRPGWRSRVARCAAACAAPARAAPAPAAPTPSSPSCAARCARSGRRPPAAAHARGARRPPGRHAGARLRAHDRRRALRLRRRAARRAPSAPRCGASSAPACGARGRLRAWWALPPRCTAASPPAPARILEAMPSDDVYELFQNGTKLLERARLPRRRGAAAPGARPRARQDLDPRGARPGAVRLAALRARRSPSSRRSSSARRRTTTRCSASGARCSSSAATGGAQAAGAGLLPAPRAQRLPPVPRPLAGPGGAR